MKTKHSPAQTLLYFQEPLAPLPYTDEEKQELNNLKLLEARLIETQNRLLGAAPHAYSTEELADLLQVSPRRILEIQQSALKHLRKQFAKEDLQLVPVTK